MANKSKALLAAEARIAELEAQRALRSDRITELEAKVAALEAQVSLARTCYRELKNSIAPVAQPAQQPRNCARGAMPVVTRYQDALGRTWIKTRTGSKATSRLADANDGAGHDRPGSF